MFSPWLGWPRSTFPRQTFCITCTKKRQSVHASVRVNRGSRQRARERLRRYNSAAGQLARRPAALECANQPEASGEIRASWSQQHLRQVVGASAARACRQEISTELGGDGGVMVRASSVALKGAPHFLTTGHAHAHTPTPLHNCIARNCGCARFQSIAARPQLSDTCVVAVNILGVARVGTPPKSTS